MPNEFKCMHCGEDDKKLLEIHKVTEKKVIIFCNNCAKETILDKTLFENL